MNSDFHSAGAKALSHALRDELGSPLHGSAKLWLVDEGVPVHLQRLRDVVPMLLPLTWREALGPQGDGRQVPQAHGALVRIAIHEA